MREATERQTRQLSFRKRRAAAGRNTAGARKNSAVANERDEALTGELRA